MLARRARRLDAPQRKQRRDAGAGELGLAIAADVLQEQVAEGHGLDPLRGLPRDERAHDALVLFVRAGIGDRQQMQRQAGGLGLGLDQSAAHAMHGDAVEGGIDGRDQADHAPRLGADAARAAPRPSPCRVLQLNRVRMGLRPRRERSRDIATPAQPPARSSTCTPCFGLSRRRHLGCRSVRLTSSRPACQCSSTDRRENS